MRGIGIQQEWVSADKRRLQTALANRLLTRDKSTYLETVANVASANGHGRLNAIYGKGRRPEPGFGRPSEPGTTARQASYRGAKAPVDVAKPP